MFSNFYHLLSTYSNVSKNYSLSFFSNRFLQRDETLCMYLIIHIDWSPSNKPLPPGFSCLQGTLSSGNLQGTNHSFNQSILLNSYYAADTNSTFSYKISFTSILCAQPTSWKSLANEREVNCNLFTGPSTSLYLLHGWAQC